MTAPLLLTRQLTVAIGGRPIVAWGHGTAGVGDSAAPSRYPWLYPEPASAPWLVYGGFVGDGSETQLSQRNWIANGDAYTASALIMPELPLRVQGYVKFKF